MTTLDQKVTQLRDLLASFKNVVVWCSGGVDSTYLLSEAVQVLGQHAVALGQIHCFSEREAGEGLNLVV